MGVRGLTSYVDSLPTGKGEIWEIYELCDTKLVIDGNGLFHNLYSHYNLDCKYGGQYSEYEEKVKEFFNKLSSHGVQPYVIFDGILDESEKKLQTVKERKAERIKRARDLWKSEHGHYDKFTTTLPLLTQLTLIKVLQDLQVPYAVADFEADHDIASLANEFHGPVMGQDSDYFIFNIQEGYIPFDKFEFSGPSMTTKRFHSARLANHLNINSTMLPMLASLVGNDYVSDEILKPFKTYAVQISSAPYRGKRGTILATAEFLSGCESLEEAIANAIEKSPPECKKLLKKVLRLSVDEYQLTSTNLRQYFKKHKLHSNLQTYNEHALPKWVIELYREGGIAEQCINCWCHRKVFLKVQVEDMSKPSTNHCTLKIRKFLYKILMKHDEHESLDSVDSDEDSEGGEVIIKEYDREGLSLTSHKHVLATAETKVDISNIPTMEKHTKVTHLLNVLSCDLSLIQHLPESHQLVVAALKYWVINTTPPVTEVHLASILVYYIGVNDNQIQCRDLDARGLHGFAQWQNVVYWVYFLNSIFGNEFPSLNPVRLYGGVNVCKLYQKLKAPGTIIEIIVGTFVSDIELFKQLYDAVVQELPDDITSNLLRRTSGKKSKETKEQREVKTKTKRDFLKGNQFEQLCLSSDTDED